MGVMGIRFAMGCPARMGYAQCALKLIALLSQFGNPCGCACPLNRVLCICGINHSKSTGVIATVLKATQTFN
jgi:hypothetical protein